MRTLVFASALCFSLTAFSTTNNLPDNVDANTVPASEEAREEEIINTEDSVDLNDTPAELEQREEDEKADWIESEDEYLEEDL